VDWAILILVLAFAIRGLLRGMISQFFSVLGLLAGLWVAAWISQWVGEHWKDARPAVAFVALRWILVALAALAVAGFFQWCGSLLGDAVRSGPVGWLERPAGLALGALLGLVVSAFALLGPLLVPWPPAVGDTVARARSAPGLMRAGVLVCRVAARYVPGSEWLEQRFAAAERRVSLSADDVIP
jgi:membrane protein required for colicin V production